MLTILSSQLIEFKVRKVKACSIVKKTVYKEKEIYSDGIFITKSIHYKEINIRVVYIL